MAAAGKLALAFLQQQLRILIRNMRWHHGCQTCPHRWSTRDVSQVQNVKWSTLVVASHLWCIISLISLIFCLTVWVITGLRQLLKTDVMMSTTVTGEISRWSPSLLIHEDHWGEHVFNIFFFFNLLWSFHYPLTNCYVCACLSAGLPLCDWGVGWSQWNVSLVLCCLDTML